MGTCQFCARGPWLCAGISNCLLILPHFQPIDPRLLPPRPHMCSFLSCRCCLVRKRSCSRHPNDMSGPKNLSISSPMGLLLVVVVLTCFLVLKKGSHRSQTGFELAMSENDFEHQIFLPVSLKAWGHRHAHLHSVSVLLGFEPRALHIPGKHPTN